MQSVLQTQSMHMILMEVFIPVGQILKGMGASMTKLFSYVVTRDYGFAPNPFHSY